MSVPLKQLEGVCHLDMDMAVRLPFEQSLTATFLGWRPWSRSAGLGRGSKQRRRGKLESKRTLDMQPPGAL